MVCIRLKVVSKRAESSGKVGGGIKRHATNLAILAALASSTSLGVITAQAQRQSINAPKVGLSQAVRPIA